jgi:predicted RNase H-like HicB family nuclease
LKNFGVKTPRKMTMAIQKGYDGWFVGKIDEVPGVLTQGKTVEETRANLKEALALFTADDSIDS